MQLLLSALLLVSNAPAYPLLDGDCAEYAGLRAPVHEIAPGIRLHVFADAGYVWLCYTVPADSHGTLDLRVETPRLDEPLNLHVSAQLGEWRADHPEEAPQDANSDQWWKIRGWYSNALRLNGVRETDNGRRTHFVGSKARELQLSRARFGGGEWRLAFDIGMLRGADGEWTSIRWPRSGPFVVKLD